MLRAPATLKIIQGDSNSATLLGSLTYATVITLLSLVFNTVLNQSEPINVNVLVAVTGVMALISAVVIPLRVKDVREVFEHGVEVKAQVISKKVHRANLKLGLRYTYLGQVQEKTFDQVVTNKTKHFIEAEEVAIVIDQSRPDHILLRDAFS